jgi:hypothetical protein
MASGALSSRSTRCGGNLQFVPEEFIDTGDHVFTSIRLSGSGHGSGVQAGMREFAIWPFREGKLSASLAATEIAPRPSKPRASAGRSTAASTRRTRRRAPLLVSTALLRHAVTLPFAAEISGPLLRAKSAPKRVTRPRPRRLPPRARRPRRPVGSAPGCPGRETQARCRPQGLHTRPLPSERFVLACGHSPARNPSGFRHSFAM